MDTKTCSRCKKIKELGAYYSRYKQCKQCCLEVNREYRRKNKDRLRVKRKQAYWRDPDKAKKSAREWLLCHPEKKNAAIKRLQVFRAKNARRIEIRHRDELSESYVMNCLRIPAGYRRKVPKEVVELKRAQLQIFRAVKVLNNTIKEKSDAR